MRITDIHTVWQRRSLIPESVPRETIPKARSKGSRSRKKIFRKMCIRDRDGVERPCDEKENEYLLQIRDSAGIPGHYEK